MDGEKKHLLIVMVGTSPAVITETVYALCKEKSDPPDEVIVYTTSKGKIRSYKSCLMGIKVSGPVCFPNWD